MLGGEHMVSEYWYHPEGQGDASRHTEAGPLPPRPGGFAGMPPAPATPPAPMASPEPPAAPPVPGSVTNGWPVLMQATDKEIAKPTDVTSLFMGSPWKVAPAEVRIPQLYEAWTRCKARGEPRIGAPYSIEFTWVGPKQAAPVARHLRHRYGPPCTRPGPGDWVEGLLLAS